MRESSLWTYPVVNLCHILGIASLFGAVLVLDLRLLGLWQRVPLGALTTTVVPVATSGFVVAVSTGVGLLATKATEYYGNLFLLIKFSAIAFGIVNVALLHLTPAWQARERRELSRAENRQLALIGGISLACWVTAIAAGRLIAYW